MWRLRLVVDELRVFLVGLEACSRARRCCSLAIASGVHMCSSPRTRQAYSPPASSMFGEHRVVAERGAVQADRFFGDLEHADAADLATRCRVKYLLDQRLVEADRFENLRAAVRHVGRNAHLRHDLRQALADRLDVVVDRLLGRQVARQAVVPAAPSVSSARYGMHGFRAVAGEQREVMHLARRAGLDDQARASCAGPAARDAGGSPTVASSAGIATLLAVDLAVARRSGCCGRTSTASTASAHSDASRASTPSLPQATG